jgi:Family of unknown function (DUF6328)
MTATAGSRPNTGGRDESTEEALDRNTIELLNELRVAGTGIQVLFAFLLIVPFNTGWKRLSSFDRTVYYVTLVCIALSATVLLAPSIHHRLLFRHREKRYLIVIGNRFAIIAMAFLGVGLTGIMVLISDVVINGVAAALAGGLTAAVVTLLWFAIPLNRRREEPVRGGGSA